jgi:hypothetical protein
MVRQYIYYPQDLFFCIVKMGRHSNATKTKRFDDLILSYGLMDLLCRIPVAHECDDPGPFIFAAMTQDTISLTLQTIDQGV